MQRKLLSILLLGVIAAVPAGVSAADVITFRLPNGISGVIVTPEYLADRVAPSLPGSTRATLTLDDGTSLPVITTTDDPSVTNKGDGAFHPFDPEIVLDLLGDIDCPHLQLDIEVYVLPYPRADLLVSSASGRRIYLSPHVIPIPRARAAYTVAHEVGHVFHLAYLPDSEDRQWRSYRLLRGIDNEVRYSENAAHAYQPKEIFAEDFRVLFGGSAAHYGGVVENPELPSPADVAGVGEFMARVARSSDGSIALTRTRTRGAGRELLVSEPATAAGTTSQNGRREKTIE